MEVKPGWAFSINSGQCFPRQCSRSETVCGGQKIGNGGRGSLGLSEGGGDSTNRRKNYQERQDSQGQFKMKVSEQTEANNKGVRIPVVSE